MKIVEIMLSENSWVGKAQTANATRLMAHYGTITPGMFVQLNSWHGDVWAEVVKASMNWKDPAMNNVMFYRYEKYGTIRKKDMVSLGQVRKFAHRPQVNFKLDVVMAPSAYYSHGHVVLWGTGKNFVRDPSGYEIHPTKRAPAE